MWIFYIVLIKSFRLLKIVIPEYHCSRSRLSLCMLILRMVKCTRPSKLKCFDLDYTVTSCWYMRYFVSTWCDWLCTWKFDKFMYTHVLMKYKYQKSFSPWSYFKDQMSLLHVYCSLQYFKNTGIFKTCIYQGTCTHISNNAPRSKKPQSWCSSTEV